MSSQYLITVILDADISVHFWECILANDNRLRMNKIKLLGPPSVKYERLKNRIVTLMGLSEHEIQLVEIRDINRIVEEDVQIVPTALYEGDERHVWTIATSLDEMLRQLGANQRPMAPIRQTKSNRQKRRLDPLHELDD